MCLWELDADHIIPELVMLLWILFIRLLVSVSYCYYSKYYLKQRDLLSYSSGGLKFETGLTDLKSRCQQGCMPFGGSKGAPISLSIPVSRGCISWLMSIFHHQSQQLHYCNLCFHYYIFFSESDPSTFLFHL